MTEIKEELIKILSPIFGKEVEKILIEHYDSNKPEEILVLAHHMLTGYMGEKNADKLLLNLLKKFPKVKVEIK